MKVGTAEHHLDTDGVVPYESSHLPGAASEVIVPGVHPDVSKREVTQELRRILFEHIEHLDAPGIDPAKFRELVPQLSARR
jgi:hypothetical protein